MRTQRYDVDGDGQIFPSATEPCVVLPTERSKLKATFIQRDKSQLEGRIKDLEKTIRINKEIIAELLNGVQGSPQAKGVLEKMNHENRLLQTQLKTASKERDDYRGKLLISEQIISNYKTKEQEQAGEFQEKIRDLLDQLDQKEYVLQYIQLRYNRMEAMLRKYSAKEDEIFILMRDLASECIDEPNSRITNVIEENKSLLLELKEAKTKIKGLESKLASVISASEAKTASSSELFSLRLKSATACKSVKDAKEVGTKEGVTESGLAENMRAEEVNKVLCARIAELEELNQELQRKNSELVSTQTKGEPEIVGEAGSPGSRPRCRKTVSEYVEAAKGTGKSAQESGTGKAGGKNRSTLQYDASFGDISSIIAEMDKRE